MKFKIKGIKKSIIIVALFIVVSTVWGVSLRAEAPGFAGSLLKSRSNNPLGTPGTMPAKRYREGQVLVKFRSSVKSKKLGKTFKSYGATKVSRVGNTGLSLLVLKKGSSVMDAVKALRKNKSVIYAEPNYLRFLLANPNDPKFSKQWALKKMGVTEAWDIQSHEPTTVAVLDSGVEKDHEDLKDNLLTGKHFYVDNKGQLKDDNDYSDEIGHGTHVSGIIAAVSNNGVGVAGVSPYTRILPVKIVGDFGIDDASIAAGIKYASDKGAQVINMSLSGPDKSEVLVDGVSYAYSKGCTIVAASGNEGDFLIREYPAALDHVIAVGATDRSPEASTSEYIAPFSSAGDYIDVCAPGTRILSTYPTGSYYYESGTSMATPGVVGVAALIKSKNPSADPDTVEKILEWTSLDLGDPGRDQFFGYGRVDALAALKGIGVVDRYEPNDTTSSATLAHLGNPMLSVLTSSYDVDWYTVNVNSSTTLSASLEFASLNSASVSIYDSAGTALPDADSAPTSANVAVYSRGFYLLEITKTADTSFPCNYKLTISSPTLPKEVTPRQVRPAMNILGAPYDLIQGQAPSGEQVKVELLAGDGSVLESQTVDVFMTMFVSEHFDTSIQNASRVRMTVLGTGASTEEAVIPLTAKADPVSSIIYGSTVPSSDVLLDVLANNYNFEIERELSSDSSGVFSTKMSDLTDLVVGDQVGATVFDESTGNSQFSMLQVPGMVMNLAENALFGSLDDKTLDKIHVEVWRGSKLRVRTNMTRSFETSEVMGGCSKTKARSKKADKPVIFSSASPWGSFVVLFRSGFVMPGDRIYAKAGNSTKPLVVLRIPNSRVNVNFKRDVAIGKTGSNKKIYVLVKRFNVSSTGDIPTANFKGFLEDFLSGSEAGAMRRVKSNSQGRFVANFKRVFDIKENDELRLIYFDNEENQVINDQSLSDMEILTLRAKPNPFSPYPYSNGVKDSCKITFTSSKSGIAKLAIRNSKGRYVRVLSRRIKEGNNSFTWNGKDTKGLTVASGAYRFKVIAVDDVGNTDSVQGKIFVDTRKPKIAFFVAKPNPFLPYPDGWKDFTRISFRLSEPCTVKVVFRNASGKSVRKMSFKGKKGKNGFIWTGVNSKGLLSEVGKYRINIYAIDRAGNTGRAMLYPVKLFI